MRHVLNNGSRMRYVLNIRHMARAGILLSTTLEISANRNQASLLREISNKILNNNLSFYCNVIDKLIEEI